MRLHSVASSVEAVTSDQIAGRGGSASVLAQGISGGLRIAAATCLARENLLHAETPSRQEDPRGRSRVTGRRYLYRVQLALRTSYRGSTI